MFVNGDSLVRTRFAPSPTGYLHIGGVRTALFNYFYARHFGGSFILRIDDTDADRNKPEAIKPIIKGLEWLGIDWDEGPIRQSERKSHYQDIALALIKMGCAYPDPIHSAPDNPYRGMNRNMTPTMALALWDDTGWAIRFRIPEKEKIVLDDLVRGNITWDSDLLSDPVILRSNGTPTYNFATVVDDGEMKITHVIRGEEHLSNTPIQLLMMNALGHVPPFYAHVPYVCEPNSNKKLSKRDSIKFITDDVIAKLNQIGFTNGEIKDREELNPVSLTFYDCLGYKPSAVINYLSRLGWSVDDKTEIMPVSKIQKVFDLKRVKSGPARFDPVKMLWVNHQHTKNDTLDVKTIECIKFLQAAKLIPESIKPADLDKVRKVVEICGERIKCYSDILKYGSFFFANPHYDYQDVDKYLTKEVISMMETLIRTIDVEWKAESLEDYIKDFMNRLGEKPTKMIFAIRVALCGHNIGPGLFESMELLGKEICIDRMTYATSLQNRFMGM